MDIVFQFGEFWLEQNSSFWVSLLGALIGAGVALLLFLLEGKRIRKNERQSLEKELLDLFDYLNELIKGIKTSTQKQATAFETHANNLKNTPYGLPLVEIQINQDLDRISNKMNLERLYQSYLLKNGNEEGSKKEFKKLISTIDHAKFIIDQAKSSQEKHFERQTSKLEEFKDLAEEQTLNQATLFADGIRASDPDFEHNAFYQTINECVSNYYTDQPDPITVEYLQSDFINPFKLLLVANFRHIGQGLYLADKCRKATWLFSEIKVNAESAADEFTDYAKNLVEDLEELDEIKGSG